MAACGTNLLKFILLIFNIVFGISGLGILLAGSIVLANLNDFSHFIEDRVIASPIVLIVTGIIIFLIAILGCFGAIKESPILLFTYAILLSFVFIIELSVGIASSVYRKDIEMMVKDSLKNSIERSNLDDIMAWNNIQQKLMCCGIEYPYDWRTLSLNKSLPSSCCRPQYIDENIGHCRDSFVLGKDKYFQEGCLHKLKYIIERNTLILIGVGIGIAFLQILGIILSSYLASRFQYNPDNN